MHLREFFVVLILISNVIVCANRDALASQPGPVVTGFTPVSAPAGGILTVSGSGLSGTTSVLFAPTNNVVTAAFSVIDDSSLKVTVPTRDVNDPMIQGFIVEAGNNATLVMGLTAIVTSNVSYNGGVGFYDVRNGGVLTGGSGSALMYIEAGGVFNDTSGGTRIAVVEAGGTYNGVSGGETRVYAEPGANVTLGTGGGNTLISLDDVSLSGFHQFFLYSNAPEPASWIMIVAGGAAFGCVAKRNRYRKAGSSR